MSSPKSVYVEVGLTGQSVSARPKRPKNKQWGLFSLRTPKKNVLGHKFREPMGQRDTAQCVYCGMAKFTIDGQKCRGKRVSKIRR